MLCSDGLSMLLWLSGHEGFLPTVFCYAVQRWSFHVPLVVWSRGVPTYCVLLCCAVMVFPCFSGCLVMRGSYLLCSAMLCSDGLSMFLLLSGHEGFLPTVFCYAVQ